MDKYVISEDVAADTLERIEEEFGACADSSRPIVLDAIRRGLIDFDETEAALSYSLQKPVELKNGQRLERVTLREPDYAQIERINKGIEIKIDAKGGGTIDASVQARQVARIVCVIGGVSPVQFDQIKRRDYAVLEAIAGFFG